MRLALVTALLFLTPAFADGQCQLDCLPQLQACMQPCSPGGVVDLEDPKKKEIFVACAKKCAEKVKPCMDACNPKQEPAKVPAKKP